MVCLGIMLEMFFLGIMLEMVCLGIMSRYKDWDG